MNLHLSGWCSPCEPGDNHHDTCQTALDRGRLIRCDCPGHPQPCLDVFCGVADCPQHDPRRNPR